LKPTRNLKNGTPSFVAGGVIISNFFDDLEAVADAKFLMG